MKIFLTLVVAAVTLASLASSVDAQGPVFFNGRGQQVFPEMGRPMHVPQYPAIVTQPRFDGFSPWGINTRNEQIDNTYFMGNRNSSRYNGSRRQITRPVYDQFGRVTGYETGHVWNNSVTGQEHGDLQQFTNNGQGGTLQTYRGYSMAGGDITPMEGN